jgi:release factor glutamine methyltransferase
VSDVITWAELVDEAARRLAAEGVPEPAVSARWIGREATGTEAGEWPLVAGEAATERQLAHFDRMLERRATGEPLQYVLGRWGFRTLDLLVDRRVLIPRPETEVVAQVVIDELDRVNAARPHDPSDTGPAIVVDLGTGSGAIGLSVAAERRGTEVWLTDASADALDVARANLAGLGWSGGTVRTATGDWFEALPSEVSGRIAVVASNPPYVADPADLEAQVADWEPAQALLAPGDGMAHLEHLVDEAPRWLRPDGALVMEMAPDQVPVLVERAQAAFVEVEAVDDLAGRPRAVVARRPVTPGGAASDPAAERGGPLAEEPAAE